MHGPPDIISRRASAQWLKNTIVWAFFFCVMSLRCYDSTSRRLTEPISCGDMKKSRRIPATVRAEDEGMESNPTNCLRLRSLVVASSIPLSSLLLELTVILAETSHLRGRQSSPSLSRSFVQTIPFLDPPLAPLLPSSLLSGRLRSLSFFFFFRQCVFFVCFPATLAGRPETDSVARFIF